jgi:hypothetical protein
MPADLDRRPVFVGCLLGMAVHGLVLLHSAPSEAGHPQDDEYEPDDPDRDPNPGDEKEEQDPDQHERNGYADHVLGLPGVAARKQGSLQRPRWCAVRRGGRVVRGLLQAGAASASASPSDRQLWRERLGRSLPPARRSLPLPAGDGVASRAPVRLSPAGRSEDAASVSAGYPGRHHKAFGLPADPQRTPPLSLRSP